MRWWYVPVGVLALGLLVGGGVVFVERAKRGRRLTTTKPGANGAIATSPEALRAEAARVLGRSVSQEAYSLARMLASEGSSDNAVGRRVRAWVLHNDWRSLQGRHSESRWPTLTSVLTYSTQQGENGLYGEQAGRRFSTARDPYEGDLSDAEALLTEFFRGSDPTAGATKFIDLEALGKQAGTQGKTLASIEKDWGLKGRLVADAGRQLYIFGGAA